MYDALGYALMIKVEDFLAEMKILKQRRTACTLLQAVLVVRNGNALLGGKRCDPIVRNLMGFAAICLWLGIGKGNLSVLGYGRRLLRRSSSDIRPYKIGGRHLPAGLRGRLGDRSDERRVGKECCSTWILRWSQY